jgi:hypothetical protein
MLPCWKIIQGTADPTVYVCGWLSWHGEYLETCHTSSTVLHNSLFIIIISQQMLHILPTDAVLFNNLCLNKYINEYTSKREN